jgi:Holliday junction resolvasome RuvABC ATP-dependent DNA helicase subunit
MNTYSFSTINDKDFEVLVLDLLNEEYSFELQNFKAGKDGGIDLRYSTTKNKNSIVVQAKHYLKSDFKALIRILKKEELNKVLLLKPERYILATSLELSSRNKDEIKEIFFPYILSSNDIFGNEDINKLLRKHKDIEKKHFKLWFSSIEIISTILNNAIEGRTRNYLERIKSKIPFYVLTKNFDEANKILAKEKILLIAGQPGIGKTTLAEALLYEKAKSRFKIYLINTVREAEDVISRSVKEKQVFYFDDFLGEVYYEIISGSQKESEISNFVDRVKNESNKFIILSTRTVILEQARAKSEKIKRSKIESGKYEIILDSYTNLEKGRILYNHLFFQNLESKFFQAVIEDKFYMWIIKHKNYNPRIIEFITNKDRIKAFSKFEFKEFITKNLTYPEEIWHDSYQNQIEYLDRCLLQTIFSFQRGASEINLRDAFEKRLNFEKKNNNKQISAEQFSTSVKNLMNGFIISSIVNLDKNIKKFNFINPSISDFLISYLNRNYSIKKAIIQSIVYLEQLEIFDPEKGNFEFEIELQNLILKNIRKDKYDSADQYKEYKFIGYKIEILIRFCKDLDIDNVLLVQLKQLKFDDMFWVLKGFELVLDSTDKCPKSKSFLKNNFNYFIEYYIEEISEHDKALKIPKLFKKFDYNFKDFVLEDANHDKLIKLVTRIANGKERELMETHKNNAKDWSDFDDFVYDEVKKLQSVLLYEFLPENTSVEILRHYEKNDLEEQLKKNSVEQKESLKREAETNDFYNETVLKFAKENEKINDLFYVKN